MIEITRPLMTLLRDGAEVSQHRSEVEAMERASKEGPGQYVLVRPNATIVVGGVSVPPVEPEPEPDPIPDPDPEATPEPDPEPTPDPEKPPLSEWDGDGKTGHPVDYQPDPEFDPTPTAPRLDGFDNPIGQWTVPNVATRMPRFLFEGGWRHAKVVTKEGLNLVESMKGAFCVTPDAVWMANHRNKAKTIVRFERPVPALTTNPADMPIAAITQDGFEIDAEGHVKDCDVSGVFYDDVTGLLYVSICESYDAGRDNTRFLAVMHPDGSGQRKWFNINHRQMAAGQILKTPAELRDSIGRLYMHPEHWTNIISRVCQGAGLHGWDGQFPASTGEEVTVRAFLQFPHDGRASDNPRTFGEATAAGTKRPANAIFNRLSKYEVSFFWKGSYISIGKNAGQRSGITYGKPIGANKGNHTNLPNDYANYFWIWDTEEILSSAQPWDAEPKEWGYLDPHIPEIAGNQKLTDGVLGGYFDPDESRLWLLTFELGDRGNMPMILQYKVTD